MMTQVGRSGLAMMLIALSKGAIAAGPGSMGPQSQAQIVISVRVAPRFSFVPTQIPQRPNPQLSVSSNAPALRYTIEDQETAVRDPASGVERELPGLWLVVPD